MKNNTVLIVDDEPDIRELLEITLQRMGLECVGAASLKQALEYLSQHSFALCLTDMNLGDGNGLSVIEYIQQYQPHLPVAMITAYGNMETAVIAMKAGAFDYVAKPIDLPKLRALVQSALRLNQSEDKKEASELLGQSQAIQRLKEQIRKLARSMAPVFIQGEAGSGKELVARLIHQQSPRAEHPFIAVNCGAIPSDLLESELFGREKTDATDTNTKKVGLLQAAEGGTLFLDEIADLPKDIQVKLLHAIQEKAIRPIGSSQETPTDVRILSAAHKNLVEEIKQGSFRQDLYYRINVIELLLPSLRERPQDIAELSQHILNKVAERYESRAATLSNEALKKLQKHSFPGNVRELENILERAFTLCENQQIEAEDLHLNSAAINQQETINQSSLFAKAKGRYDRFIEDIEKKVLLEALEQTDYNKTQAADLLGISFRTIRYKLKKFDME